MKKVGLPPRIDASPEEIAGALFRAPLKPVEYREYRCKVCHEVVKWPDVLFRDGTCLDCATQRQSSEQHERHT